MFGKWWKNYRDLRYKKKVISNIIIDQLSKNKNTIHIEDYPYGYYINTGEEFRIKWSLTLIDKTPCDVVIDEVRINKKYINELAMYLMENHSKSYHKKIKDEINRKLEDGVSRLIKERC